MFGIAAVVAFAIALFLDLAGLSKGHISYVTFALAGLLCLAIDRGYGWYSARRA